MVGRTFKDDKPQHIGISDADTYQQRRIDSEGALPAAAAERWPSLIGSVVIFTVIPAKAGIQRPLAANAYLPATGF